jgi:putative endonuclease
MAIHNEIGRIGEEIAVKHASSKGLVIIKQNYLRKWGEIDIVARETSGKVHFIEVKTVSYETVHNLKLAISRGEYRPEENVHVHKQNRLKRAIQTWILENNYTGEFQIDIMAIRLVPREKYANVHFLDNVVFE